MSHVPQKQKSYSDSPCEGDATDVAEVFATLEEYHPCHLVAWLQRRFTRVDELPVPSQQVELEDWYAVLQVDENDSEEAIRRAYKKLALVTHPDKPTGNQDKFLHIAKAHSILSDRLQRQLYDQQRRDAEERRLRGEAQQPHPKIISLRPGREVAHECAEDLRKFAAAFLTKLDDMFTIPEHHNVCNPGSEKAEKRRPAGPPNTDADFL